MKRKMAYIIGAGILLAGAVALGVGYIDYTRKMDELRKEELNIEKGIYIEGGIRKYLEENPRNKNIDLTKIV